MGEHPHPDNPIVHHAAKQNGNRAHAQPDGPQDTAHPDGPAADPAVEPLIAPRRFLLCHDDEDDLDEELPLVATITPDELSSLDPARVRGHGLETSQYAILSLGPPGGEHRELARCASALSALSLFGRVLPLRLVFLDPPDTDIP